MHGLYFTSKTAPFLKLANSKEIDVSDTNKSTAKYQFFDMLENPVSFSFDLYSVEFVSSYNKHTIPIDTESYSFKKDSGSLSVRL